MHAIRCETTEISPEQNPECSRRVRGRERWSQPKPPTLPFTFRLSSVVIRCASTERGKIKRETRNQSRARVIRFRWWMLRDSTSQDGVALPRAFQDTYNAGTRYAGELADSASKSITELHETASSSLNDMVKGGLKYFNADPVDVQGEGSGEAEGGGDGDAGGGGGGGARAVGAGGAAGVKVNTRAHVGAAAGDKEPLSAPPPLPRREPISGPACDPGCEEPKVCLEGKCACPVLYRGGNCSAPVEVPDDPAVNRCLMGVNHPRFKEAIESKYGNGAPKGRARSFIHSFIPSFFVHSFQA